MRSGEFEFVDIDGLDTPSGLRFFAGQAAHYQQALQTFAAFYRDGLPGVDDGAGAAGLLPALHALAGASLVLGATALGTLAQRVEAQLNLGASVEDARHGTAAVQQALAALVQQLQARRPAV